MKTIEIDGKLMMNKSKDDLSDPTDDPIKLLDDCAIVESKGLLNTYIRLLELEKKKAKTLESIICSVIHHKVDGSELDKRTLIGTIKRIDCLNHPEKLRELIENILNKPTVKVWDIYGERALGWRNFKFSNKFKTSLKKVLY